MLHVLHAENGAEDRLDVLVVGQGVGERCKKRAPSTREAGSVCHCDELGLSTPSLSLAPFYPSLHPQPLLLPRPLWLPVPW